MSPSESAIPTQFQTFATPLPQFVLQFDLPNPTRRRLAISEELVYATVLLLLSTEYDSSFASFYSLELELGSKTETVAEAFTTSTYPFTGSCIFTTDDPDMIPTSDELASATTRAFIEENVNYIFGSSSVSVQEVSANYEFDKDESEIQKSAAGTVTITIVACVVAVFSTLTALGLIFAQRRKLDEENINSPTKAAKDENSPKGLRLRSPFPIIPTPPDGTRKYFCRLDDESVNSSKGQINGYLNPDVSIANSSVSKDEESSLEAPSMSGLSSICENSKLDLSVGDGASYADMSALDEVRLGRVLNLDDSLADDFSLATCSDSGSKRERISTFAKLWYGNRRMQKLEKQKSSPARSPSNETNKLAPPKNDSPTKKPRSPSKLQSPSKLHSPTKLYAEVADSDGESVAEKKKEAKETDDNSLLGNQSDKGDYYGQNDESNLFYNMLGDRSVNSMESDSVDFNEMYDIHTGASSMDEESSTGARSKMDSVGGLCGGE